MVEEPHPARLGAPGQGAPGQGAPGQGAPGQGAPGQGAGGRRTALPAAALGLGWLLVVAAATGPLWGAWPRFLREVLAGVAVPSPARLAHALGAHAGLILAAAVFLAACRGAGEPVRRLCRCAEDGLARGWTAVALGFGALGTAAFGLALAGLFFPVLLGTLAVLSLVAAVVELSKAGHGVSASAETPRLSSADWPVALLVGAPALMAIPLLLVPSPYIDAYEYHLAAPEQFLKLHRFVTEGTNPGFHLQLTCELLNSWAVIVRRDELAAWIAATPYVAAVLAFARWTARIAGPAAAGLGLALAVTLQPAILAATTGKNDLAAAGFCLLALLAQSRARRSAAAVFWGLACASKINGFAFAGLAWLGWEAFRLRAARGRWRPDAGWLLLATPVPLAWLLKEWLTTGDPLWPVFSRWLPGALWDPALQRGLELLTGRPVLRGIPGQVLAMLRETAPGVLAVLPAAVLLPRALSAGTRRVGVVAAAMLAVLAVAANYEFARLTLPLLAFWGFLSAAAVGPSLATLSPFALGLALVLAAAAAWAPAAGTIALSHNRTSVRCLLGAVAARDVVAGVQTTLWETREAMRALPDVRGVLLVSENSMYRFPGRIRTETFHDRKPTWVLAHEASNLRRLLIRLRQQNVTHIVSNLIRDSLVGEVVAQYQYYPWTDRDLDLFAAFMERHTRLVIPPAHVDHGNGGFHVWRIAPGGVRNPEPVHFLPGIQEVKARLFQPWFERQDYVQCRARALAFAARYPHVLCFRNDAAMFAFLMTHREDAFRELSALVRAGFIGDQTHLYLGHVAIQLDRPADAIPPLKRSLELYPDQLPAVRERLAAAYGIQSQHLMRRNPVPPDAIRLARAAVAVNPGSAALRATLGNALFALGRFDEAEAVFREVLARWPGDPTAQEVARKNIALCMEKRGKTP